MRSERFPPVCAPIPGRIRRDTPRGIPFPSLALSECPDGVRTVRPQTRRATSRAGRETGRARGSGSCIRRSVSTFGGPIPAIPRPTPLPRAELRGGRTEKSRTHTTGVTTFLVSPPALTAREPVRPCGHSGGSTAGGSATRRSSPRIPIPSAVTTERRWSPGPEVHRAPALGGPANRSAEGRWLHRAGGSERPPL